MIISASVLPAYEAICSEERPGGTLKETISICAANDAPSLLTDERYGASA